MMENELIQEQRKRRALKFSEGRLDEELILETLSVKPGRTILDAGCGTGYMSRVFAERTTSSGLVYALDKDPHFVELIREESVGSCIKVLEGDMTMPGTIPEHSVDVVYASTVVWLLSRTQLAGFVLEVKRVLKPGGLLAIVEMDKKETPFGPPVEQRYSPKELRAVIALTPLDTVKVGEHYYMQIFVFS